MHNTFKRTVTTKRTIVLRHISTACDLEALYCRNIVKILHKASINLTLTFFNHFSLHCLCLFCDIKQVHH